MRTLVLAAVLAILTASSASAAWPRHGSRYGGYQPSASAFQSHSHVWQYYGPYGSGWGVDTPTMSVQYGIAPQQQFFGPMPYYGGYGGYGGFGGYGGYGGYGAFGGMGGGW